MCIYICSAASVVVVVVRVLFSRQFDIYIYIYSSILQTSTHTHTHTHTSRSQYAAHPLTRQERTSSIRRRFRTDGINKHSLPPSSTSINWLTQEHTHTGPECMVRRVSSRRRALRRARPRVRARRDVLGLGRHLRRQRGAGWEVVRAHGEARRHLPEHQVRGSYIYLCMPLLHDVLADGGI